MISLSELKDFIDKMNEDWSKLENINYLDLADIFNNFNLHLNQLEEEKNYLKKQNTILRYQIKSKNNYYRRLAEKGIITGRE